MPAAYILATVAIIFAAAAAARIISGDEPTAQSRTWLLVAAIFAIVSGWLFYRG
jgi:hypothetical protein